MLTHANISINCQQGAAWADESRRAARSGRWRRCPFFHVFAMTAVMNFAMPEGAEIIIMPRFVLDDAMKLIDKTKPTVMPGVPTMFIAMLSHPKLTSFDLSSLKYCVSGGAPLPVDVKERFETLTGCKVVEGYGLSEARPSVTCNPVEGPVKAAPSASPCRAPSSPCATLPIPRKEVPLGREGRDLRQGSAGDEGLLEAAGGDRQPVRRRLPAHRRRRHDGRGRLHLHRRPHQGS